MLVTKKKGSKGMLVTKINIKTPLLEWKEESSEKQKGEKITCILTINSAILDRYHFDSHGRIPSLPDFGMTESQTKS